MTGEHFLYKKNQGSTGGGTSNYVDPHWREGEQALCVLLVYLYSERSTRYNMVHIIIIYRPSDEHMSSSIPI